MRLVDMTGKVALVTGAASGIGRATAETFVAVGASVVISDINEAGLREVAKALEADGAKVHAKACNVADLGEVEALHASALSAFGRVDSLANVAGHSIVKPFVDQDQDQWRHEIEVNLWGAMYTCRVVLDEMLERKSGSIVTVSSDAGRVGSMGETVYAAAKSGVIGFTKSLAREMGRHGIRVNCVSPGPTDTPATRRALGDAPKVMEKMIGAICMKRLGLAEEQANVIVFLASDAASYVTGQVLSVNGGLQMVG